MNLKQETLWSLSRHDKTPEDIKWIGCYLFKIPQEEFWKLADKEYDNGYGHAEVAEDLFIVGDNWWLTRREYDGSEWWEYNVLPIEPNHLQSVPTLFPEDKTDDCFYLSDFYDVIDEYNRHE